MTILGYPIQALFLYFIFYSFLGWLMETCYCSILEHRLVDRGFLYGPICPIYGAGVLLMVLFFTPLKHNLFVFYLTAVVVMTSWEYFVAWLLETTTHVRYWDYSRFRFNIKGRVCLWVALVWGALSYVVIFWIHPAVDGIYQTIPGWLVNTLCVVLLVIGPVLSGQGRAGSNAGKPVRRPAQQLQPASGPVGTVFPLLPPQILQHASDQPLCQPHR